MILMVQETELQEIRVQEISEEKMSFLLGTEEMVWDMPKQKAFVPFAEETMSFLAALSKALMKGERGHRMPDVASFAFWCRSTHLEQMRAEHKKSRGKRLGRGVSLHFAPSNIPVLFAYTMAAGLLAGNCVIVRLPQKVTEQQCLITEEIQKLLADEYQMFLGRIVFCRYAHLREVTDRLSQMCDVRVIWGADNSVNEIRKSPLPSRAIELPFASRQSAVILCAKEVLDLKSMDLLVQNFYNDTYLNDQNACSSPRLIYWLGTEALVREAQDRFWKEMYVFLQKRNYTVSAVLAVQKLDSAFYMAAAYERVKLIQHGNQIVRVQVPCLEASMWKHTVPGGFFVESFGDNPEGMCDMLTDNCQTLCTFGIDREKLAEYLVEKRVDGVDRIVPVGRAMDFSLYWDGMDLIDMMSRRIDLEM